MSSLDLQRFLRQRRDRIVRPTPPLWRRVRRMARGQVDPELVETLLVQPGWQDLSGDSDAALPLLVRQLGDVDEVTAACACALIAGGILDGAVPARPEVLAGVHAGLVRWGSLRLG